MITEKTYKALKVLQSLHSSRPMTANEFAFALWGKDEEKGYLFTAVTNGGNGACAGKKAWLCAGSLLGKLAKKGLTRWECKRDGTNRGYSLTSRGIEAIKEYEKNRSKD